MSTGNTTSAPQPTIDPCVNKQFDQRADERKHKKKGQGGISKAANAFLEFIIKLLNLIISLFGGQPITPPATTGTPQPTNAPQPTIDPNSPPSQNPSIPQPSEDPCKTSPAGNTPPVSNPTTGNPTTGNPTTGNPTTGNPTTGNPPATASCSQEEIQKLVDSVSEENIRTNLLALVKNNPTDTNENFSRHVSQPGNRQKTTFIQEYMQSIGLTTTLQPFTVRGTTTNNVIGVLPGTNTTTFYDVSAHIDSTSPQPNLAPGADDNASGVATILEAARVLKGFSSCLKTSIQFVGFNFEEGGINGSAFYVQNLNGKTIKGNFNVDMVGSANGTDCVDHFHEGDAFSETLSNKMVEVSTKYNIGLQSKASVFSAPSDNRSYTRQGISAVSIHECVMSPVYHQTNDTSERLTFSQITKTTKALVAAVAEMASQ